MTEQGHEIYPDFLLDSNAVLKDQCSSWRYGKAPDYTKTRAFFEETKSRNHAPQSLAQLTENLVKNWEIEASFKRDVKDWRVVDHKTYNFVINGGEAQTAEQMLKVGTYNAILTANDYYCPARSDFDISHSMLKRTMPTFAWEVLEVYSGPPMVAFKWRHWGVMESDYIGLNPKGEKVTLKAHGGAINIQGMTVAYLDEQFLVTRLETWFNPLEMFRQMARQGLVDEQIVSAERAVSGAEAEIFRS